MKNIVLKALGLTAMLILLLIAIFLAMAFSDVINSQNIVILSFVKLLFDYPFVIPACLIFLPSLLWKRSMFLAYSLTLGLILIAPSARSIYLIYSGYNHNGFGEALSLAVLLILGFSYIMGLIIRATFFSTTKNSTKITPSEFSFKTSDIVAKNTHNKNSSKFIKQNL